eukprot:TRINITY_DN6458_c0_g1_i1.p1 TRINITY_DN6458_c0_g1~~TRINITY_DN6458_c0_g1_i1.p1  ORF type:complete len:418 (+),score=123.70 TRINITY_DN6458_c0_g1_i1:166-1419(+)
MEGNGIANPSTIDPQYEFAAPQYVDFLTLNENASLGEDRWFDEQVHTKYREQEEGSFIESTELLEMHTVEIFEEETFATTTTTTTNTTPAINTSAELKISDLSVPKKKPKTQPKDANPPKEVKSKHPAVEFLKNKKKRLSQQRLEERKKRESAEKLPKASDKPQTQRENKKRAVEEKQPIPNKRAKQTTISPPSNTTTTTTTTNTNNHTKPTDVKPKIKETKPPHTTKPVRENALKSKPFHFEPTVIAKNNNNNNDDNDNHPIALTVQTNTVETTTDSSEEKKPTAKQTVDPKKQNATNRTKTLTFPKSPSFMHRDKPKILSTEERQLLEILEAKKALREHIRFGKPLAPPPHPVLVKKPLHKTMPVEKPKNKQAVIANTGDNAVKSVVVDHNKENEVNKVIAPKQGAAQKPLRWRM